MKTVNGKTPLKYSASQVISLVDITPAQFKDWTRKTEYRPPLISASFKADGPPNKDYYSWSDVLRFGITKKLSILKIDRGWIRRVFESAETQSRMFYPFDTMFGQFAASVEDMDHIENNLSKDDRVNSRWDCYESLVVGILELKSIAVVSHFRLKDHELVLITEPELTKDEHKQKKEGPGVSIKIELLNLHKQLWAKAQGL